MHWRLDQKEMNWLAANFSGGWLDEDWTTTSVLENSKTCRHGRFYVMYQQHVEMHAQPEKTFDTTSLL